MTVQSGSRVRIPVFPQNFTPVFFRFSSLHSISVLSVLTVIAIVLGVLGIVGSIVPALPGPPLGWAGLLLVFIDKGTVPVATLVVWAVVVAAISILDYVVPSVMTKAAGGHKAASRGAAIGLFAGIFLTPVGMIAGSLLGAFLGELLVEKTGVLAAAKASLGAFVGFIAGTFGKVVVCLLLLLQVILSGCSV